MATIYVGQGARHLARTALQTAKVPITREGYSDSSTTTWAFVVRTRKTASQLQRIVRQGAGIDWVMVDARNAAGVGRDF